MYCLTSSLKDRQGSKPSPRTEQPSGIRSTEFVRHSGGSSMKTPHCLSAFVPCFASKELLSHRFSQQSAWRSLPLCLRSPAVGEVSRRRLPSHLDKSGLKEWVKKHQQALGRALANLVGNAAAALPGNIGSIVSWLLSTLGKTATWLAENLWTLTIAVGTSSWLLGTG